VAARLGIGAETLRGLKPSLVYASLSGYGQAGPWRDQPGHDFNYLAAAGALSFKGHWTDAAPHRSGLPVADLAGGCFLAIGVLAALSRARASGEGATLDISLLDAAMSFMSVREGFSADRPERQHLHPTNDLFATSDGERIALGIVEDRFWAAFVAAARDLDAGLADERFAREPDRRRHGDELHAMIAGAMARCTAEAWLARFAGHDVPAQRVLMPREASESPHVQARGLVRDLDGERHVPFPAVLDGEPCGRLDYPAPELGADSREILQELGFAADEIRFFSATGAIPLP
jgi:crotonobetainyl-CoA:carnitine CoA-transferase CaiB-like acyl-CoA transferase